MKTARNKLFIVLIPLFAALLLTAPLHSDVLSDQTLRNDIRFYHKTADAKQLNANDRTYILKRIEEKYEGTGIDTDPLELEFEKVASGEFSVKKPSKAKPADVKTRPKQAVKSSKLGKVEKIFVSETKNQSKIIIAATGVARSNYSLMRDSANLKPPVIIVDLYGVESSLIEAAQDINPKQGLFSNISAGQFEGPPNNIVRVAAQLRRDTPYTVKKEGQLWIVAANKPDGFMVDAAAEAFSGDEPVELEAPDAQSQPQVAASSQKTPAVEVIIPDENRAAAGAEITPKLVNNDYKIENSDILGVTIYPAEELSREAIVQPDGKISFPLIGSAQAKGLTIKQLEINLAENLSKYISTPQVSITVKQFSRRQIFITGEVKSVGAYSFKENLRLLEFISSIGGFTESANRREVKIYRGPPTKRQIHMVNVEEIVKSGDFSKDFLLESGDIIEVQKGQAKIAILGDVRSPGYYDYKDNMRLVELVSIAGGFNDSAKIKEVNIIHQVSDTQQTVTKADLNKILSGKQKDLLVQSGDTVYIPKGQMASANFFVNNILPWVSLIALVVAIRGGI